MARLQPSTGKVMEYKMHIYMYMNKRGKFLPYWLFSGGIRHVLFSSVKRRTILPLKGEAVAGEELNQFLLSIRTLT